MTTTTNTVPFISTSTSDTPVSSSLSSPSSRFAVLGSGASTASPWLQCIISQDNCCPICKEACANPTMSYNVRNNVSALLTFYPNNNNNTATENTPKHVMIDAGKTMRSTIWKCFPQLKVSGIDALLLTHAHADAYLGLDDLRDISPKSTLPIYLTQSTYDIIENAFPYLCNRTNIPKPASTSSISLDADILKKSNSNTTKIVEGNLVGSTDDDKDETTKENTNGNVTPPKYGHGVHKLLRKPATTFVAQLDFRIITPWVPFVIHEAGDIIVTPIPVQHGYKTWDICMAFEFGCRLPLLSSPSLSNNNNAPLLNSPTDEQTILSSPTATSNSNTHNSLSLPPFSGSRILYISDVNAVSDEAHAYFRSRPIDLLLLDCLNYGQYPTHFSMLQAINCTVSYQAKKTRFIGMNHRIDHTLEHEKLQLWGNTYDKSKPLDIGLAHDCDPFNVDIAHTITPTQLQNEIESIRKFVQQQRDPNNANEPVMEGYTEPVREEWKDENSPTVQKIMNGWQFR